MFKQTVLIQIKLLLNESKLIPLNWSGSTIFATLSENFSHIARQLNGLITFLKKCTKELRCSNVGESHNKNMEFVTEQRYEFVVSAATHRYNFVYSMDKS